MGCDGVRWQGLTTRRAHARKEEQHRQRTPAQLSRVRSAVTQQVKVLVAEFVSIHAVFDAGASGQLPFLGSSLKPSAAHATETALHRCIAAGRDANGAILEFGDLGKRVERGMGQAVDGGFVVLTSALFRTPAEPLHR